MFPGSLKSASVVHVVVAAAALVLLAALGLAIRYTVSPGETNASHIKRRILLDELDERGVKHRLLFLEASEPVLIDRYNRKMMMLLYDFMSLSALSILIVLQSTGNLQVWYLYLAAIIQGVGYAFQSPSYTAAISIMVPQKQYTRANALMSLLNDGPDVFGPLLAGGLYVVFGLEGVLAINLLAFVPGSIYRLDARRGSRWRRIGCKGRCENEDGPENAFPHHPGGFVSSPWKRVGEGEWSDG